MMIAAQQRAVRNWAIQILGAAGVAIPADRVVVGNQDANAPRPYLQLIYTGSLRLGAAPERRPGPALDQRRSYAMNTSTVSLTFVGVTERASFDDGASALAAQFVGAMYDDDYTATLDAQALAIDSFSQQPSIDALTGQSQWETRAAVDITFNVGTLYTSQPGTVETTEVAGTTEPPTSLGSVVIP